MVRLAGGVVGSVAGYMMLCRGSFAFLCVIVFMGTNIAFMLYAPGLK